MTADSKIYLPDLEMEGMKEIYACLEEFGLNDGEFTFAPAIGGVLVYNINTGFIWFPMIVMEALGTSVVESQITESIGNYAGTLGGMYIGGAAGGAAGAAAAAGTMLVLSKTLRIMLRRTLGGAVGSALKGAVGSAAGAAKGTAMVLGFSGGFLAVSVLAGVYLGGLVGKKAVRKLGFQDPPEELTPYPKQIIHHIEILVPSILAKSLDTSKKAKDAIVSVITKKDIEHRGSLVLCIVTRFKPQTGELSSLVNRIKSETKVQEKNRPVIIKPVSKLWGSGKELLGNARVGYFNLSKYVDTIRFKNTEALQPLINTIKAQEIPLVEKYKGQSKP